MRCNGFGQKVAQLSGQYAALRAEKQAQYAECKALRQDIHGNNFRMIVFHISHRELTGVLYHLLLIQSVVQVFAAERRRCSTRLLECCESSAVPLHEIAFILYRRDRLNPVVNCRLLLSWNASHRLQSIHFCSMFRR